MWWLIGLAVIAVLLLYFFVVRPVLKTAPMFSEVFAAEASFWEKMQVYLAGWKTTIVARLFGIGGVLVGIYDQVMPLLAGQDWTPISSRLPGWTLPVAGVLINLIFEWLRHVTANPPGIVASIDDSGQTVVEKVIQPKNMVQ